MSGSPSRGLRVAAVIAMAVVLAATGTPVMSQTFAAAADAAAAAKSARTVTLITGDTVSVAPDGSVAAVQRAEGREKASFQVRRIDGHTYVIPGDAALPTVQGKLDRRLFDVTRLLADGYADKNGSDLPLIVTYTGSETPAASAFRPARAKVSRTLDEVNGVALRADRRGGAAFWETFTDGGDHGEGTARLAGSPAVKKVEKVWLDGRRQVSLDRSVPQIGAPTAWDAGFDGTGVKVAVLDTGVDRGHPDLAGRVIAHRNFSDPASEDTVDANGHGTHVASTIAGTGAESQGRYKGVAPGARILDGKILDDRGYGWDSDIIAGMEWAVAEDADIVSMSLGGTDTLGVDPLEETVNRLSATTDTLFVIAAGNAGYAGESTVGSPGSAESALTVGAVDKDDQLADFSSRGPRVGDGGLKPDLTAPGVDITAAASTTSEIEDHYPSGTPGYATLSGTSMATPHVAGAAALLAQEHPDWTGERIKAVLTGSTEPGPYSAYQQGTGRTDVARAIGQTVVAENGPISFGRPAWPHTDDQPVNKEITYRNLGTEPVVLDLSMEALGVDGKPAPEGLFDLSARQVTVPAGGTASVTVTADTRVGGEVYGSWGGSVTAASADGATSVRTAFGVEREAESYNLTIRQLDDEGKPSGNGYTMIDGRDRAYTGDLAESDGEATIRLPKGSYALTGILGGADESAADSYFLAPAVELDKDTTIVMDAREAESTRITVPDAEAKSTHAQLMPGYTNTDGTALETISVFAFPDFRSFKVGQIGDRTPKDEAYAQYSGFWSREDADGRTVTYRMAWNRTGSLGGFTADVRREDLAKIDMTFGTPLPDTGVVFAMPYSPDERIAADFSTPVWRNLPQRTTEYILGNGVKWGYAAEQWNALSSLQGQFRAYEPGRSYTKRLDIGVFGPSLPPATGEPTDLSPGLARRGNTVSAVLPLFGDGEGNVGSSPFTLDASLRADGEEIPGDGDPTYRGTYTVPAEAHRYELSLDATRDPELFPVSTRVRARWTFRSAQVADDSWTRLPLSVVRFSPELSPSSTARAGERFEVPFTVEGAAGRRTVKKLTFEVSYDEGGTWTPARTVRGDRLALKHPAQPGTVSLRVKLTDRDGNTLVQTVDRAYLTVR
ncbi:S8 family serine peptidase [Streptomyces sp. NBC_00582]|uniref:S8 family serine peptidase n=1 Tax=Streptomyces sp. NBC_00582 TaxID=2975783 RepID=UPI002E80B016|nr:S8 family serine peptidase [Streptomyces sp. NBC_00582]WUB59818.1 S8 family serine peptidase [Streptomyces sp. NBC_00582]